MLIDVVVVQTTWKATLQCWSAVVSWLLLRPIWHRLYVSMALQAYYLLLNAALPQCSCPTLYAHMPCLQAAGQATGVGYVDPSGSSAAPSSTQLQPHRSHMPPQAARPSGAGRSLTEQKLRQVIAQAMEQGLAGVAAGGGQPDALDQRQGAGSAQAARAGGHQQDAASERIELVKALLQASAALGSMVDAQVNAPQRQHTGAEAAGAGAGTSQGAGVAAATPGLQPGLGSPGRRGRLVPVEPLQGAPAGGLPGAAAEAGTGAGGGGHSSLRLGAAGAGSGVGPSSAYGAAGHQVPPGAASFAPPPPTLEDQLSSLSVQVSMVIGSQKQCWS
jgi:hypothetical protein